MSIKVKLNFTPHKTQQQLLDLINEDGVKYITCCAARRYGKSILARYLCLKWSLGEPNQTILYICPTYKLVNEFFRKFIKQVERLPFFDTSSTQDKFIRFTNGSEIKFFSATAHDSIRGFEATHAILDEFAFYPNLNEAWEGSIRSVVRDKGKKVLFISTPMGKRGKFWEMFSLGMSGNPRYRSMQASAMDSPFTDLAEVEDMRTTMSDRAFRQEVLAQFLDIGQGGVFKNILNCIDNSPKDSKFYYGGLDIGFSDSTVLTILNEDGQMVQQTEWEEIPFNDLVPLILAEINKYNMKSVLVEKNGIGKPVFDYLHNGNKCVEEWVTTNQSKQDIINGLMLGFEQNTLTILDDSKLINQLDCYEAQLTKSGKQTFNGVGAKDDRVMSLAIAHQCLKKHKSLGGYAYATSTNKYKGGKLNKKLLIR